ncbi:MAG: hypothetical protein ACI3V0_01245 [Faecousia sp.]
MKILMWILILAGIFSLGFLVISQIGRQIDRNPRAFPASRRLIKVPLRLRQKKYQDDGSWMLCYNDCNIDKELQEDEKCES